MNLSTLAKKTQTQLVADLNKTEKAALSGVKLCGKIVCILARQKPAEQKTLAKYLGSLGVTLTDPRAYSAATVCAVVSDTPGTGRISEADYDAAPVRWLAEFSAVIKLCQRAVDGDKLNEGEAIGFQEQAAKVIREKQTDAEKSLKAIKGQLQKLFADNAGGGETDAETGKPTPADEIIGRLQAVGVAMAQKAADLSGADFQRIADACRTIMESALKVASHKVDAPAAPIVALKSLADLKAA